MIWIFLVLCMIEFSILGNDFHVARIMRDYDSIALMSISLLMVNIGLIFCLGHYYKDSNCEQP